MPKKVEPMEKITQRSVGFKLRQILFFANYQEFNPDEFCRQAIDEQIKLIDRSYLKNGKRNFEWENIRIWKKRN